MNPTRITSHSATCMGFLPDTQNCMLCMCRECRERLSRHWLQRKLLVRDPDMHHDTCVMHVPWSMVFGKAFPAFPEHAQPAILCTCTNFILSSDDNKAAWPLSSSVRSFFSTSNLSAYLRFIDMGELQKWALRANKLIKRFSLDIQVAKNVLNLSTSWYLIWLVCTINGRRYRWVLYGKWKILRTALFHAVHINSKLELDKFQAWLP